MSDALVPSVDVTSAEFWRGLERGELVLSRCGSCGRAFFPPMPSCPECGAEDLRSFVGSGRGTLYSWVVVHIALDAAFADDVPYTVVAVDLEEGGRMLGRLHEPADLVAGAAMEFQPFVRDGVRLPGFRMVAAAGARPADAGAPT
jgi:uncharacterized OB-fold protein